MNLTRRDFAKAVTALSLAPSLPASHGPSPRLLVAIFLRGGQDALATLIPHGDKLYPTLRPTLAIGMDEEVHPLDLDGYWGLHPAFAPLLPYWNAGQLAPLINVGSPHPTRSHFDAQDFMEYGAPGLRTVRSGWLNRHLQATRKPGEALLRALALQTLLPRALRGDFPVLAAPDDATLRGSNTQEIVDQLYADSQPMDAVPRRDDEVIAAGRATIDALRRYQEVLGRSANTAAYPQGPLAAKLSRIARVVKSGEPLEVACADYGGWDHHANEGDAEGQIARMLAHLAGTLAAFAQDLGEHFARTLVLTMSEFGRTCRENGNRGTDHGHGGLMLAFGGGVAGKKVHGKWLGLAENDLYESRDLPVTTDFRDVFAEILTAHLGARPGKGQWPEWKPGKALGLLR